MMTYYICLLVFFVTFLPSHTSAGERCPYELSSWCKNLDTARECQVVKQCQEFVWSRNALDHQKYQQKNVNQVQFVLYYETLCPDCKNFMKGQLWKTYYQIQDIMNLTLVPYGNAMEKQVGDKWEFTCQHGALECVGNVIHTCSLHLYGQKSFPMIQCMEASLDSPLVSAPRCAATYSLDYKSISKCANSTGGNTLEHQMAVLTNNLVPAHEYVPWVTLNGVHTEDIQQQAQDDLLKLICDTYKGKKPKACLTR